MSYADVSASPLSHKQAALSQFYALGRKLCLSKLSEGPTRVKATGLLKSAGTPLTLPQANQ